VVNLKFRVEKDILGELKVPANVYWGINTQRAINNFKISGKTFPSIFIMSLAQLKKACLLANLELDLIDDQLGDAILKALDEILKQEKHFDQFPIDIYQTGSGTQTNMNMNEVLANRANEILGHPLGKKNPVHPNDHVNKGQSSNDVFPSVMHISIVHLLKNELLPSLSRLIEKLKEKVIQFNGIIKVGRTHLQDAVPIPLSLEFQVYLKQIENNKERLNIASKELYYIPIGGTALGTGLNTHEEFAEKVVKQLFHITGIPFKINPVKAEGISSHISVVNVSSQLKSLSLSILKIANDIRWMGSGPRAGLSELILPQNEPGSSIMPGKINPTQSEALIQVCLQVIGNDSVVSSAEAFGSILDLNVCKPIMISNTLESIKILTGAIDSFVIHCLDELKANQSQIENHLERLLMLVTNLTPILGYDKCSLIAKKAYDEGKTIKEVINEMGIEIEGDIDEILNPKKMV
jgi:fumarate hydratase class II